MRYPSAGKKVRFRCDRVARYTSDFYAGEPAVTLNYFGLGRAYYLAAKLEPVALGVFLRSVCAEHGVTSLIANGVPPSDGVEVTVRAATGNPYRGQATLAPRGVLFLQPIIEST